MHSFWPKSHLLGDILALQRHRFTQLDPAQDPRAMRWWSHRLEWHDTCDPRLRNTHDNISQLFAHDNISQLLMIS